MKKFPSTFLALGCAVLFMFFMVSRMMHKADDKIAQIKKERAEKGGASAHERELNAVLNNL